MLTFVYEILCLFMCMNYFAYLSVCFVMLTYIFKLTYFYFYYAYFSIYIIMINSLLEGLYSYLLINTLIFKNVNFLFFYTYASMHKNLNVKFYKFQKKIFCLTNVSHLTRLNFHSFYDEMVHFFPLIERA